MARQRKILFTRESECIQPLRQLIERQTHRTLVAWALDCAARPLAFFEERIPKEVRPREAMEISRLWARGEVKMPFARRAILAAHRAAGEAGAIDPRAEAAARAVGHACATIHAETHALGLVFYWLSALFRSAEPEDADRKIQSELRFLTERLLWWEQNPSEWDAPWAVFLRKDMPNKERLRHERE
ncbi:MAG: hypothetical protein VB062_02700 [Christensenella sp.]|nr:hypothetical protein [Christensenella sp.]